MTYNTRDLTNQWSNAITGGGGPPVLPDLRLMTDQQLKSLQDWSGGAKQFTDSFGALGIGADALGRAGSEVLREILKKSPALKTPQGQKLLDKFIDALGGAAGDLACVRASTSIWACVPSTFRRFASDTVMLQKLAFQL